MSYVRGFGAGLSPLIFLSIAIITSIFAPHTQFGSLFLYLFMLTFGCIVVAGLINLCVPRRRRVGLGLLSGNAVIIMGILVTLAIGLWTIGPLP